MRKIYFGPCSINGCGGKVVSANLCGRHYARFKRHGDAESGGGARVRGRTGCLLPGCERPHRSKGFCAKHYQDTPGQQQARHRSYLDRRPKVRAQGEAWTKSNKDRRAEIARKHQLGLYALTPAQYEAMRKRQENRCAVCHEPERKTKNGVPYVLSVDHCHRTGVVRGLLCSRCNTAIGMLRDDPGLVANALRYLSEGVVNAA